MLKILVVLIVVFSAVTSSAASLADVFYNPRSKNLTIKIAYEGQTPNHKFELHFDECKIENNAFALAARLVDLQGDELAEKLFTQTVVFDLSQLECMPAMLTVRLGKFAHATLWVQ